MTIREARREDLREILELQYQAYQSEAELHQNYDIPPLKQTMEETEQEFEKGTFLKLLDDKNVIIGSVRAYSQKGTLFIGKLMVHPDFRRRGLGLKLLKEIENVLPHKRYELFTSSKSRNNIQLYQKSGYRVFAEKAITGDLTFIYLEKTR